MSLYEALDRFAGAGVLATAGLVGAEMPPQLPLDGAALSRFLRERGLGDELGRVLDVLANEVWLAQERRGFSLQMSQAHAAALAGLLSEARIGAGDLALVLQQARDVLNGAAVQGTSPPHKQLTEAWIARANAAGLLQRAGLVEEVVRFLLEQMLLYVVAQPRLLLGLEAALIEYRAKLGGAATAQALPQPALPPVATAQPPRVLPATIAQGAAPAAAASMAKLPSASAVGEIRARHRLSETALRRFQTILAQHAMSAEHRLARLDELAGWLTATVVQLRQPANEPADVRRLKSEAATALEQGDLERAMDLLKALREHARQGRRRAESRMAEELQALKAQMIEEAMATARLGELAQARLELDLAADHFADAAGQLPAGEPALELDYRQRQAEALAGKAELGGDARALAAAAAAFRACRALMTRAADTAAWARVHVGLGDMLMALGIRQEQPSIELEEAAGAYAEAAGAVDRATHPMQWALVQLSHAAALVELGARVDRERHWKTAATALMPALEIFESRNAADLAEAALGKLRLIAAGLRASPVQHEPVSLLEQPARSA